MFQGKDKMQNTTYDNLSGKELRGDTSLRSIDKISEDLASVLDLDPLEAELYFSLVKRGEPTSSGVLSKELNINRPKTYRSADKLVNMGILYATFSNPKLYYPAKPDQVLKLALRKKNDEITSIEKVGKKLFKEFNDMISLDFGKGNVPMFQVIHGTSHIHAIIEKMIEESTGPLFIVSPCMDLAKMYYTSIPEKIKMSEKKGGKVSVFTEINDNKMIPFVKRLNATQTRIGKLPSSGEMIVSNSEMLISDSVLKRPRHSMTSSDYAFCTNSSGMLDFGMFMCEFLWRTGEPLKNKKS